MQCSASISLPFSMLYLLAPTHLGDLVLDLFSFSIILPPLRTRHGTCLPAFCVLAFTLFSLIQHLLLSLLDNSVCLKGDEGLQEVFVVLSYQWGLPYRFLWHCCNCLVYASLTWNAGHNLVISMTSSRVGLLDSAVLWLKWSASPDTFFPISLIKQGR